MSDDLDPLSHQVAGAYDASLEREWTRLVRDAYHSLEFDLSWEVLTRRLKPGCTVLDAGGGPGRYTLALARAGYRVYMVDLSPAQVDFVRQNFSQEAEATRANLLGCETGDICDLSRFEGGVFDAVICLGGPLTHLPEQSRREAAVRELERVARSGGEVFLTGVGYLAVLRYMLNASSDELLDPILEDFFPTGNLYGPTKTLWHFFRADELRALGESAGMETLEMRGLQGLSSGLADSTNRMAENEPAKWQAWKRVLLRTAADPTVVDGAEHILWVGRTTDGLAATGAP